MRTQLAPSILAADLACLADEVARAEEGGCDTFHVDIMDFHFVPNLSFGPSIVETMRRLTDLPLDVHLMTDRPLEMIEPFAKAGSDYLTVHVETVDIPRAVDAIKKHDVKPGISLKPDAPVEEVIRHLSSVDLVLIMSVYPGFGGQSFIEDSYDRIRAIADASNEIRDDMIISVDGGVNFENAGELVKSGINYLVAGTTVFRDHGAVENMRKLRACVEKV